MHKLFLGFLSLLVVSCGSIDSSSDTSADRSDRVEERMQSRERNAQRLREKEEAERQRRVADFERRWQTAADIVVEATCAGAAVGCAAAVLPYLKAPARTAGACAAFSAICERALAALIEEMTPEAEASENDGASNDHHNRDERSRDWVDQTTDPGHRNYCRWGCLVDPESVGM